MTYTAARTDIATVVQSIITDWTAYSLVVETDNRDNVDYPTQENPFLQVDTLYFGGEQLEIGKGGMSREWGQIILSAVTKSGTGVLASNTLLDFVVPYFYNKDFSSIRVQQAQRQADKPVKGWYYCPVLFNFYFLRS